MPFATGMALTFCFVCFKQDLSINPENKRLSVIWPRIDQKTCFKAILTADCDPVVVQNKLENGDEVVTDLAALEHAVKRLAATHSPCLVVSTTSCFAPRAPEDVVKVARICKKYGVPHVINNAYGFQSMWTSEIIETACRKGRVDYVVMSTDKNFMVPVGGAIIASPNPGFISKVSELYPGRASISPTLDLLITLLSMGRTGYNLLRTEREKKFTDFRSKLSQIAEKHGERLLNTTNPISMAITLNLPVSAAKIGAKLFNAYSFGARCVEKNTKKNIGGTEFEGYGAHCDNYPHAYLACAVAVGATDEELDTFLKRLDKALGGK